jgi:hypothetical protein
MLHVIRTANDPLIALIKDDPVRPEIPGEHRVGTHKEILVLSSDDAPRAVVCVSYQDQVPSTVEELTAPTGDATIAVFYTIWSYAPGAGREMIFQARDHVMQTRPTVTRFVTLSPPTEMAKRFHLKNGAGVFRINADTVNYEYHS